MPESPVDTFIYFAYGSNMLSRRLQANDRAPSAIAIGIGFVQARKLTFDKRSRDCSGKCDIEITNNPECRAYGVLFKISLKEKISLGKAEGLGNGYEEKYLQIIATNGEYSAVAYVATVKESTLKPYHWYKNFVIAGALEHRLPNDYIEWLRTIESQADPDTKRSAENEASLLNWIYSPNSASIPNKT